MIRAEGGQIPRKTGRYEVWQGLKLTRAVSAVNGYLDPGSRPSIRSVLASNLSDRRRPRGQLQAATADRTGGKQLFCLLLGHYNYPHQPGGSIFFKLRKDVSGG